jgi:GT2 family glycosyltransferase
MRCDVVVPVYRDVKLTLECLNSVVEHSKNQLGHLIVVNDASPETGMADALKSFRYFNERVRLLTNAQNKGFVFSANLGLAASTRDAILLNSDTRVTANWMSELVAAGYSDSKIAALSPLSNNATFCSVTDDERAKLAKGKRVTVIPTAHGFCLLMKKSVRVEIGLFDPAYGRGYNEENDWCQRARAAGYVVGRANWAFVFHHGEVSFQGQRKRLDVMNARRLVARYPAFYKEMQAFDARNRNNHSSD